MVSLSSRGEAPLQTESKLRSLTGMRFIAAFMVFAFHTWYLAMYPLGVQPVAEDVLWQAGWTGVGFFFVLSGFVLAWSAQSVRPHDTARGFWGRRFFKIWPNHAVTWVAMAILLVAVAGATLDPTHALANLLLIQSWFPQAEIRGSFNGPAWSLSCEALFYLLFPLLMRWIGRIRPERLWAWAGGVVAAIFAIPFIAKALPETPLFPLARVTETELWIIYQFPPARALDFVFGILLARIVMTGRKLPFGLGASAAIVVAAYVAAQWVPAAFSLAAVTVVPLGLLIAAAAKADIDGKTSWLSSRPMVWLGEVSFAFYLWHAIILFYVGSWLFSGPSNLSETLAEIAVLLGITLIVSWLQFSIVERPVMRRFTARRIHPVLEGR